MAREPQFLEHACIATRMLDKRRQLFDLKDDFDAEKAKYERRCEFLRQKEAELSKRDLAFQQSLVRFEAFSKENESKHLRAAKRLAEEINLWELKDKETAELLQILEEKKVEEQRLHELVNRKMPYQDYLEASANHLHLGPNCYTEVFDILNRYELLKQTSERTRQRLEILDAEIITHQEELERLQVVKRNIVPSSCSLTHERHVHHNNNAKPEWLIRSDKDQPNNPECIDGRVNLGIAYIAERFERQGGNKRKESQGGSRHRSVGSTVNDRGDTDDGTPHEPGATLQTMEKISQFIQAYSSIVDQWENLNAD